MHQLIKSHANYKCASLVKVNKHIEPIAVKQRQKICQQLFDKNE